MLKWIAVSAVFLVPFIPVIVAPHSFFPFITGKNFMFRILVEVMAAAWILLVLRDPEYRPKRSGMFTAAAVFVLVVGIADVLGVNVSQSIWSNFERMEGYLAIVHLFLYFLVAGSVLNSMKLWDRFFYTSIGVSIFLALYGFIQLSGELNINQGGVRLDSTFGNATYFGIYLLFHIFFLLMLFLRRTKDFSREILISYFVGFGWFLLFLMHIGVSPNFNVGKRMYFVGALSVFLLVGAGMLWSRRHLMERRLLHYALTGAVLLLQFAALYYTATRGAIMGLIGGFFLTAILVAIFERNRKVLRRIALGSILFIFLGVGAFYLAKDTPMIKNSPVLSRFTNLSFKEVGSRPLVWNMAIQGVKERPVLGWGQSNFDAVFNKYYDPRMYSQEPWFDRAHDIFFDWLVSAGVVGLASYLALFAGALIVIWKDGNGRFSLVDKALLTGLLAGYIFHNLFVFDNVTSYIAFFSLLAYVYYMTGAFREARARFFSFEKFETAHIIIAPLVVILFSVAQYHINVKPYRASRTLIDAMVLANGEQIESNIAQYKKVFAYNTIGKTEAREQLLQSTLQVIGSDVAQEHKEAYFELVKTEFDAQIKEQPLSARHHYFLGTFLRVTGNPRFALTYLGHAEELSPRKQQILVELSAAYGDLDDHEKELAYLKKAFELEKKNDVLRLLYASTAQLQRKEDLVREILEPRYGTIAVPETRIIAAYLDTGRNDLVVEVWKRLVGLNPGLSEARVTLAAAYLNNNQRDKAMQELRGLVTDDPNAREQSERLLRELRVGKTPEILASDDLLKKIHTIPHNGL